MHFRQQDGGDNLYLIYENEGFISECPMEVSHCSAPICKINAFCKREKKKKRKQATTFTAEKCVSADRLFQNWGVIQKALN